MIQEGLADHRLFATVLKRQGLRSAEGALDLCTRAPFLEYQPCSLSPSALEGLSSVSRKEVEATSSLCIRRHGHKVFPIPQAHATCSLEDGFMQFTDISSLSELFAPLWTPLKHAFQVRIRLPKLLKAAVEAP